ncbi:MAG TPA: amino acid ABC transporter permease [Desulfonatronum sp.]|nr:amino acid ABC transporter permease [Desulfonatronum sp.]
MIDYSFDWGIIWRQPYGALFLNGIKTTLMLSVVAWSLAFFIGMVVSVFRVSTRRSLKLAGAMYVEVFRNIPLLVQIFFWYFALPSLLPKSMELWLYDNISNLPFFLGILALAFYTSSRVSEVFRSSLLSVPYGQYRAAYSTGLTPYKTYRYVVVPYAFRLSIPPLTTEFLTCFKNSALTMTIGVLEITGTTAYIESFTWRGLEVTTAASFSYLAITLCIIAFMAIVEKKTRIAGMIHQER